MVLMTLRFLWCQLKTYRKMSRESALLLMSMASSELLTYLGVLQLAGCAVGRARISHVLLRTRQHTHIRLQRSFAASVSFLPSA